jgi:type 1 glutamine amidotransferase
MMVRVGFWQGFEGKPEASITKRFLRPWVCYQRAPYPIAWARQHGKGRVFYMAMGDRPENWKNEFFLNLLGGGIRWAIVEANAQLDANLKQAAPGYAENPPSSKREK